MSFRGFVAATVDGREGTSSSSVLRSIRKKSIQTVPASSFGTTASAGSVVTFPWWIVAMPDWFPNRLPADGTVIVFA
jgi:hypothetical protein